MKPFSVTPTPSSCPSLPFPSLSILGFCCGGMNDRAVRNALKHLSSEIRSATTSMTSVPKPLKFLRPHYAQLKKCEWKGILVQVPILLFACFLRAVQEHDPFSWVT